jgi:hypothetical protein
MVEDIAGGETGEVERRSGEVEIKEILRGFSTCDIDPSTLCPLNYFMRFFFASDFTYLRSFIFTICRKIP